MDIRNKQFVEEFIEAYKSFPCLWYTKSETYKNKTMRTDALETLLETYKQKDPDATVESVKKKINIMRTSFRRELNKVRKSKNKATGKKDIYNLNLWYYENLTFLEENGSKINKNKREISPCNEGNNITITNESECTTPTPPKYIEKRKSRCESNVTKKIDFSYKSNSTQEDDWDMAGKRIRIQLRSLESEQFMIAEKLISDIIFYGRKKRLTENSSVILENSRQESSATSANAQHIPFIATSGGRKSMMQSIEVLSNANFNAVIFPKTTSCIQLADGLCSLDSRVQFVSETDISTEEDLKIIE